MILLEQSIKCLKKELISNFQDLIQKIKKENILCDSFCEASFNPQTKQRQFQNNFEYNFMSLG